MQLNCGKKFQSTTSLIDRLKCLHSFQTSVLFARCERTFHVARESKRKARQRDSSTLSKAPTKSEEQEDRLHTMLYNELINFGNASGTTQSSPPQNHLRTFSFRSMTIRRLLSSTTPFQSILSTSMSRSVEELWESF